MHIVFFGSGKFGVPAFKALHGAGHTIVCAVTQPDRKQGRGMKPAYTPIKACAQALGIPVAQPEKIKSAQAIEALRQLKADVFVVIAYGQLLSSEVLALPARCSINLHASLLPKYRGAAPINWALIRGETSTGVTVIKMSPQMDAGPILCARNAAILDQDTAATLEQRLSQEGSILLLEALNLISGNKAKFIDQAEEAATFAPKLTKQHGLINWQEPAEAIVNLVRGCNNWPGAFTYLDGKLLKIHRAALCKADAPGAGAYPGEIIRAAKEGLLVACGKGLLRIEEVQLEGKNRLTALEFIAGHKISPGMILKTIK